MMNYDIQFSNESDDACSQLKIFRFKDGDVVLCKPNDSSDLQVCSNLNKRIAAKLYISEIKKKERLLYNVENDYEKISQCLINKLFRRDFNFNSLYRKIVNELKNSVDATHVNRIAPFIVGACETNDCLYSASVMHVIKSNMQVEPVMSVIVNENIGMNPFSLKDLSCAALVKNKNVFNIDLDHLRHVLEITHHDGLKLRVGIDSNRKSVKFITFLYELIMRKACLDYEYKHFAFEEIQNYDIVPFCDCMKGMKKGTCQCDVCLLFKKEELMKDRFFEFFGHFNFCSMDKLACEHS